ncbi:MAG: toxin Cry1Ac domain D-VI-related protein [Coprobacillaceae bacterium]
MKKTMKIVIILIVSIVSMSFVNTSTIEAATDPTGAPADWAFTAESIPMHDNLLSRYPTQIDTNGDGYISKTEANNAPIVELWFSNQNLPGTMDGIEYFTNLKLLDITTGNQFTGSIPTNMGNLVNLERLFIQNCPLTGTIPESLGNIPGLYDLRITNTSISGSIPTSLANLTDLVQLQLQDNKLTGSIPKELGQLQNVANLNFTNNQLTGSIPAELANMSSLNTISFSNNNLSGEIPTEIFEMDTLLYVELHNNAELTGNPAKDVPSNSNIIYINVAGTDLVQAKPDVDTITNFVSDNLAEELLNVNQDGPIDGLTQEQIDKAQDSADWISDPTEKSQWQENIDKAQNMLDASSNVTDLLNDTRTDINDGITQTDIDDAQALVTTLPDGQFKTDLQADIDLANQYLDARIAAKNAVDNLFNSDGTTIKDVTNQISIDDAKTLVDALPGSSFKTDLLNRIEEAQKQLNERNDAINKVEDLFTDSTHTIIKDTVTQNQISTAQAAVDKLPEGALKDELQTLINKAQEILNAKNNISSVKPDIVTSPNTTDVKNTINTSDTTTIMLYITLLTTTMILVGIVYKKKKMMK